MGIDFNASPSCSLGVEMELELIDASTRELFSGASELLEVMGKGHASGQHPRAKHELFESTVEIITGVCTTVAEARRDLAATLDELQALAEVRGLALMCSGTHPFTQWDTQQVTPNARYHQLVEEMQWLARRLQIFGIHVHVGVRSAEKAIAIANGLTTYLPHLLAVSASSPYWMGRDTGLASSRSKVFESLPMAGLPHQLAGWSEFEQFMGTLQRSKAITSIREVWWDIRPHPDFGTVEMRVCDGLPRLAEVAGVAALTQCLVERMDRALDRGEAPAVPKAWIVRENKWKAARYGMEADIIVDEEGTLRSLGDVLAELVEALAPIGRDLGCGAELAAVHAMVADGPSYARQRALVESGHSLADVVDALIEELRSDQPVRPGD
ncbi:MAG TPA: glutamate--cysteine ligase [Acidimicrobiales bacterium]|nr:glutamate--cysteine ligase [Acidimicrobiales bacterium]